MDSRTADMTEHQTTAVVATVRFAAATDDRWIELR